MVKPSRGLLKSIYENYQNHKHPERTYTRNFKQFITTLPQKIVKKFFPWYNGKAIITPYNTIILNEELVDPLLEFLSTYDVAGLPNPTYKLFNHSYRCEEKYKKINNGIAYLPSTANMSQEDIIALSNMLKEFYAKNKAIIEK